MNDDEKHCQKLELNEAMRQIVDLDNPHAYSTIAIVERHIRQYGLSCEPHDILSETYLRGLNAIDQGKQIQNWRAWIKGTAHNIVRERFRKEGREFPTDPQSVCLDRMSAPEHSCEETEERNLTILRQAFETLRAGDPEVAAVLDWRILEGLSWAEVRQRLIAQGRDPSKVKIEALRQKATRAKRQLRRLFHTLGGEYKPLRSRR